MVHANSMPSAVVLVVVVKLMVFRAIPPVQLLQSSPALSTINEDFDEELPRKTLG